MLTVTPRFLTSMETEFLTAVEGTSDQEAIFQAVAKLFGIMRGLAPSLPASSGFFNAYGRAYLDGAHLEFAAAECDSPYALPVLKDQQERLATRALARLSEEGVRIILCNNNNDGLLSDGANTWGCHENYLVEEPPQAFAPTILPFLATRVFAGAGGIHYPTGDFVAGVRLLFLEHDAGGGTIQARALHSTARQEHLMGKTAGLYRYHTVLGDGNRSHFSQAMKHGTTLLVLKTMFANPEFLKPLPGTPAPERRKRAFWMRAMRRFNVLANLGNPPRVEPLAIQVQHLYLDGVRRYADACRALPDWIPRLIQDWQRTLEALATDDREWLAVRLDPWIKYELFTAALREWGYTWNDLRWQRHLFDDLALLNQNYHEVCNSESVFAKLDADGVLTHRVGEAIIPGTEREPFVPETSTRAGARARLIRDHREDVALRVDWDGVYDSRFNRRRALEDPFAQEFGPWMPIN